MKPRSQWGTFYSYIADEKYYTAKYYNKLEKGRMYKNLKKLDMRV